MPNIRGLLIAGLFFSLAHLRGGTAPNPVANTREFFAGKHFLNLPVKNGATPRHLQLLVDGRAARFFDIELANGEPDWWAFIDLRPWKGRRIALQADGVGADATGLKQITLSDAIEGADTLYREALRPQFHFSSRRGWNNDPNGLVYFKGEYHLFYQHNPFGWNWGNMHWGHAVSRDLVHWEELGDVLAPDELGPMFSGSAVVDWNNTSGLGRAGHPPLILIYTAAGNPAVQCIACSTDGRSFAKFSGNPVVKQITNGNRDPKVFWHEPTRRWIMTLYVETNQVHTIHFLNSPDLKNWSVTSQIDGFFECPDCFELPVDGDPNNKKWVLTAGSSEYMVGRFDGARFTPETPKLPGHRGQGYYAAQTFSDIPAVDGRRIRLGWLQAPAPGMPFNQAMSVPTELKLVSTPEGPRLSWTPVKELESLRKTSLRLGSAELKPGDTNPLVKTKADLVELNAEFEPGEARVLFNVRGAMIAYEGKHQELVVNGHRAPAPLHAGRQRLRIFCDRTSLEVFASEGLTYVPVPFIPKPDDLSVSFSNEEGTVRVQSLVLHELKSSWRR
jgi:sucrose-6-phosphate hydrolase SacC (GH32 family)